MSSSPVLAWRPRRLLKATAPRLRLTALQRAQLRAWETWGDDLTKAILQAIARATDEMVLAEVVAALEAGDSLAAIDAIPWEDITETLLQNEIPGILRDVVEDFGQVATAELPKVGVAVAAFDITREQVTRWVRDETVHLIRYMGDQEVSAIHALARMAQQQGIDPTRLARLIRDGDMVGLTPRDVNAVFNLLRRQVEAGIPRSQADRAAMDYAQRLLDNRALTIARSEIKRAETQGLFAAWRQGQEEGVLGWEQTIEWEATGPNPCDECEALDGTVVPLGATFPGGVTGPPLHPNCNCTPRLSQQRATAAGLDAFRKALAAHDVVHPEEYEIEDDDDDDEEEDPDVKKQNGGAEGKGQRLIFVRHAEAVPHGTLGYEDDARPVTPEGEKRFKKAADGLAELLDPPGLILTSPLPRAITTTKILAKRWGVDFKVVPALGHLGTYEEIETALADYREQPELALVSHGPVIGQVVGRLLGSDQSPRLVPQYGGAVVIDLLDAEGFQSGGVLAHWLAPKVLKRLRG